MAPLFCKRVLPLLLAGVMLADAGSAAAWGRRSRKDSVGTAQSDTGDNVTTLTYNDREMKVYVPARLPAEGSRALVVVLHGGMGNAQRILSGKSEHSEHPLNMNEVAEKYGFIVAYLNGTAVTRFLGGSKEGWNAGNCCGQPAEKKVDDVGYITGAVRMLVGRYGIDPAHVYGIGHSNGGMMTQRLVCEAGLYAAAIPISGPLGLEVERCPAAQGRRILSIHGRDDSNVPIEGGKGSKGLSRADFKSEAYSEQVMIASGASYRLQIVEGADHNLGNIDKVIEQTEGVTIPEKAARFFGLVP